MIIELAYRYHNYKDSIEEAVAHYERRLPDLVRPDLFDEMLEFNRLPFYAIGKRYNYFVKALKGETYDSVLYRQMMSDNTHLGKHCRSIIRFDWK
jgi:hypothetical protein